MLSDVTLIKINSVLKAEGCSEWFVFGSHALGTADSASDIDIGVKGLPPASFFKVFSKLQSVTESSVDLVDFDEKPKFFALLSGLGELKKYGR